ncbi:related to cytochrome c oxidase assembly factor [Phialocephala subalpina]|uniref:Related to cytochrome c oxidase assembly factor n=1 Tax=Phialocephala subalpina TaxID=576137 RepID=A0A1L7WKP1_9HELO|nr:related to cytochrome c oxidase assembly factor [Phialocephala subalpina]
MSRAAKLTLAGTTFMAAATIVIVHYGQQQEKAVMHAGVIRDMDQQRLKKERQLDFDMQRALEAEYKKVQTVSDGGGVLDKPR